MMAQNMDVMLKRFDQPAEVRTFEKGKFEIVRIGGMTIGRATYEPGWRWSLHVAPATGGSHLRQRPTGDGCGPAFGHRGPVVVVRNSSERTPHPACFGSWEGCLMMSFLFNRRILYGLKGIRLMSAPAA